MTNSQICDIICLIYRNEVSAAVKKLLSFLLVITMLFALSACNKSENGSNDNNTGNNAEINPIYVGEWKANSIQSNIGGVITYGVSTITFNFDGTCMYENDSGTWKYNTKSNQISFVLDKNGVGASLEITVIDGKETLLYKSSVDMHNRYYYRSEEFIPQTTDDQPIIDDNTPTNTTEQKLSKEIKITSDNWKEYFEIKEFPLWKENAFGEIDDLALWWGIYLKEEYHNKVDLTQMGSVAFALNGKYQCAGILIDYNNQKYNYIDGVILDDIEEVSTTDVFDFSSLLHPLAEKFGFCRIWSSGLFEYELNGANTTFTYKHFDINVSRVEGNIYLLD